MANYEERLLRETLEAIYRDIVPESSSLGQTLIRRLAAGLYERGGRIQIGNPVLPKPQLIHVSVDRDDKIVWTCANFHAALGYKAHKLIGQSIYSHMADDAAAFRREVWLPALLRDGKCGPLATSYITASGVVLSGSSYSTILKNSDGSFQRTFTRIKLPVLPPTFLSLTAS